MTTSEEFLAEAVRRVNRADSLMTEAAEVECGSFQHRQIAHDRQTAMVYAVLAVARALIPGHPIG